MDLLIECLKAILLGVVQGITEWLPISSTGHMILVDEFIHLGGGKEFVELFLVVVQLGSILAVCLLYFNKLNPFSKGKRYEERKQTIRLWIRVLIACVPAGVIGVLFNDEIKEIFFNSKVISLTLILYGIGFILVESAHLNTTVKNLDDITPIKAAGVGLFQVLALIPGTSRSGSTIMGASLLGYDRSVAAEFSFFLAIPVMFGASLLDLISYSGTLDMNLIIVLVTGMITAFLVSVLAIRFLMNYIRKNDFTIFGWYRIFLGILVFAYFVILPLF